MTMQAPIDLNALGLDEAAIHALRFQGGTEIDNPYIDMVMAPAFLNADECALLCGMIDANRSPSQVAYGVANARTSETCAFDAAHPLVQLLDLRISLFLGVGPQFGEPIQGQRYAQGQEFKLHTDFFEANHPDTLTNATRCGQRTWTAMIYLNEPEAGGETFFHYLDHDFVPQTGTMLCWNNRDAEGKANPFTLHQGKPVIAGTKYIVTKWFRERPWAGPAAAPKPKRRAIKGRR
ncbi:2OG-Fe(II) oxygenase [Sphingomonas sp. RP10(2022)]|uniref:2OG-Fe(II) oxygenase n=1 Tax=Sphingomonas liriopis TaxID=2949094 RepID=A0A9X2HQV3_9SPHN|nr:2OG-Fe(II) oxygenase [Sphingomonas liriopis]MCP3734807.1 2OG-Fe(II) oxygenase [Sphingomonas liriopis]